MNLRFRQGFVRILVIVCSSGGHEDAGSWNHLEAHFFAYLAVNTVSWDLSWAISRSTCTRPLYATRVSS